MGRMLHELNALGLKQGGGGLGEDKAGLHEGVQEGVPGGACVPQGQLGGGAPPSEGPLGGQPGGP